MAPPEGQAPPEKKKKKQHALRVGCLSICNSAVFEPVILTLIIISSLCLAVETPFMDPESKAKQLLAIIETVVSSAFAGEMLIKMMAFGLTTRPTDGEPPGYFRSAWNWIDFIIVSTSIVDFLMAMVSDGGADILKLMRVARLLRTLRPLRLITRNKGLKIIVEALICAMPTLLRAIIISSLFYIGFGILFMNLLKGQLWRCSLDPTGFDRPDIVTRSDCQRAGGEWINANSNFDHIGHSLTTVLHMGTGEGWLEVLTDVVNSVGVDQQPRRNSRPMLAFLVMLFVWVGSSFLVNLMIGVLTDQYAVTRDSVHGTELQSVAEMRWLGVQRRLLENARILLPIWRISGPFLGARSFCLRIVDTKMFDGFIVVCIVANTVVLGLDSPIQSGTSRDVLDAMSLGFLLIFNVEILLKLFIYQQAAFQEPWNVFDVIIICASDISFAFAKFSSDESSMVGILDMFRILRVVRLVRVCTFLRNYCKTMLQLIPALMNVSLLLLLLLFIYACLGMGLFGTVAYGEVIGPDTNFQDFGNALLLVFRVSTGEDWQRLLYDTVRDRANCTSTLQTPEELARDGPRGCGTVLGYPFFISFTSFVSIVLMNIIIAVILEGFQAMEQIESYEIYKTQVKIAAKAWLKVDLAATGYLTLHQAAAVMGQVPQPVGFAPRPVNKVQHQLRYLPIYNGKVHFRDVVVLASKRVYAWMNHLTEPEANDVKLDPVLFGRWCSFFPDVPRPDRSIESFLVGHVLVKKFIDDLMVRRKKHKRMALAEAYINEQIQDAMPLRKGANKFSSSTPSEAVQAAGGRNAAGLFPVGVCVAVSDQVGGHVRPGTEIPDPADFEPPMDPAVEERPMGLQVWSASPLKWPPKLGNAPQIGDELWAKQTNEPKKIQEVGLVGSGFDLSAS
jgi:hypothetical protein